MNATLSFLGSPNVEFLALVLIGGLIGWVIGRRAHSANWFATLALIGVAGAWFGSEVAFVFNFAERGSVGHLFSGVVGSILTTLLWRRFHPA